MLRSAYRSLGRVEAEIGEIGRRLDRLDGSAEALRQAIRALAADDARNRAALEKLRSEPGYERAWSEPKPLISVAIATMGRSELTERSVPSVLGQTYPEVEVIVASTGAGPELAERIRALGDERVRHLELGPEPGWHDSIRRAWLAGDSLKRNAAMRAARGEWVVSFDDDDAMRPQCLELVLEHARAERAELAYAQVRAHRGEGYLDFCRYPPRLNHFSLLAAIYHAGLRFFEREPIAADLDLPGDWWLAERMLRAGVRFAMRDEVLCDHYPSDFGQAPD